MREKRDRNQETVATNAKYVDNQIEDLQWQLNKANDTISEQRTELLDLYRRLDNMGRL